MAHSRIDSRDQTTGQWYPDKRLMRSRLDKARSAHKIPSDLTGIRDAETGKEPVRRGELIDASPQGQVMGTRQSIIVSYGLGGLRRPRRRRLSLNLVQMPFSIRHSHRDIPMPSTSTRCEFSSSKTPNRPERT